MSLVPDNAVVDVLKEPCQRGQMGRGVWVVQEWLALRGHRLAIDGDFGPATEKVVRRYQAAAGLPTTGVVDATTFAALTEPQRQSLARQSPVGMGFSV